WMNKPEIETMIIDDLYNNFKIVEQKVKKSVGASSGTLNLAFMTALSTSSTNDVNTAKPAYEVSTVSPNVNSVSSQVSTTSFNDLEAMDLKWQLSLLSMRPKRYYQRTGKKIFINANDTAGYDKSKVECFNYHKMGHFARECRSPRNKEGQFRNQDNTRKQGNNEDTSSKVIMAIDSVGFDWSDMAKEQVQTNMALMVFSDSENFLFLRRADSNGVEFKGYDPENSKQESNIVCDKKSDESKENYDNSLVKEQVSKDTSSFVESSLNVDKETVFPVDKKVESVNPKDHEKPVKKSVRLSAKKPSKGKLGKPQQDDTGFVDSGCLKHMIGNITCLLGFKEFNGGYVTFGGGAHGGTISNESANTQGEFNAGTSEEISQDCIVMLIWKDASYFDSPSKDVDNWLNQYLC
ncbi:ribonuclease H-like domain-containing protein, partial [Tanacetum coccineum]